MKNISEKPVVGFATDAQHRSLVPDDLIAAAAFGHIGAEVVPVVWTEANADDLRCDLLVVRSCWDYHLRPQEFLQWTSEVGQRMPVLNPPVLLRWNADKRYLCELEAAGFPIPATFVLEPNTLTDPAALMQSRGMETAILKPAVSASAYGTFLLAANVQAGQAVRDFLRERTMILQEFIPEVRTRGEWSLIFMGAEFSHAVQKRPVSGEFRVQREFGGSAEASAPPSDALGLALRLVQQFAHEALYCRVDLVEAERGWLLMELELIEPDLFFSLNGPSAKRFADLTLHTAGVKLG